MPLYRSLLNNIESLLNRTYSNPKKWFCILASLTSGWLAATIFISVGMYISSCHGFGENKRDRNGEPCNVSWSLNEGHAFLVTGATINILIFITMVLLLIREKFEQNAREEPPPDYETLIKSETPPPPYDELSLNGQPLHVTEANEILSALSNTNICSPETSGATPQPGVVSAQGLSPLSIPRTLCFPSVETSSNLGRPMTTVGNFQFFNPTAGVVSVV